MALIKCPECKKDISDKAEVCPNCGAMMLKKENGELYCSKNCLNKKEEAKEFELICPKCNKGHMIKRVATKGKNAGNIFYGCSNYPRCKNVLTVEEYNSLITKE